MNFDIIVDDTKGVPQGTTNGKMRFFKYFCDFSAFLVSFSQEFFCVVTLHTQLLAREKTRSREIHLCKNHSRQRSQQLYAPPAAVARAGPKPLACRAAATLESNSAELLSSRDAQNIRVEKVHKTRTERSKA